MFALRCCMLLFRVPMSIMFPLLFVCVSCCAMCHVPCVGVSSFVCLYVHHVIPSSSSFRVPLSRYHIVVVVIDVDVDSPDCAESTLAQDDLYIGVIMANNLVGCIIHPALWRLATRLETGAAATHGPYDLRAATQQRVRHMKRGVLMGLILLLLFDAGSSWYGWSLLSDRTSPVLRSEYQFDIGAWTCIAALFWMLYFFWIPLTVTSTATAASAINTSTSTST